MGADFRAPKSGYRSQKRPVLPLDNNVVDKFTTIVYQNIFDKRMIHLYTIVSVLGITIFGNFGGHETKKKQQQKTCFPRNMSNLADQTNRLTSILQTVIIC